MLISAVQQNALVRHIHRSLPCWTSLPPTPHPTHLGCHRSLSWVPCATQQIPTQFSSVQLLSRIRLFATPWTAARQAFLSITHSQSLLKLMSIESVMPTNHLILCHPSSHLQSFPVLGSSQMSHFFASGGQRIGVSASTSVLPMNIQYWFPLGWNWFDILTVQGTRKSLLQHHSSKASILWRSAFFTVQLSYPYMTTGKPIALTRWTFVGNEMSLLLMCFQLSYPYMTTGKTIALTRWTFVGKEMSRLVTAFLPRSKHLLISWLQSPSAVILEPPQNKVCHCFHCFPMYLPWSDGTRCHDLSFLNVEF